MTTGRINQVAGCRNTVQSLAVTRMAYADLSLISATYGQNPNVNFSPMGCHTHSRLTFYESGHNFFHSFSSHSFLGFSPRWVTTPTRGSLFTSRDIISLICFRPTLFWALFGYFDHCFSTYGKLAASHKKPSAVIRSEHVDFTAG